MRPVLGLRWTVGDALPETTRALERSMREVWAAFAGSARLAVCVHSVPVASVRERVGFRAPATWLQVDRDLPVFVRRHVETSTADGVAWRFAPLRVFAGICEVTLAIDCAVAPFVRHLRRWATTPGQRRCLLARGRGGGDGILAVRGVPASFDVEVALAESLRGNGLLQSAADVAEAEVAMLSSGGSPIVLGRWRMARGGNGSSTRPAHERHAWPRA